MDTMAPMREVLRLRVRFGWLLLASALPYVLFLWAPFQLDDLSHIVRGAGFRFLGECIPRSWTEYFGRGVTNLTLGVQRLLWGQDPLPYRAVNLLLHGAAGWLLYGLAARVLAAGRVRPFREAAALAALFFLLHPLQTSSVTYISGRHGVLSTLFVLASLHAFWTALRGSGGMRAAAVSALFALLALGSKEDAACLPFLMALLWAAARPSAPRPMAGAAKAALASAAALALLLLAARFGWLVSGAGEGEAAVRGWAVTQGEQMYDRWSYLRTQLVVIPAEYLGKWLFPAGLSIDLDPAVRRAWDAPSAAGALALAAVSLAGLRDLLRSGAAGWGLWWLWAMFALAPSSSLQPLEETAAERRVYLASAGLAVLSARLAVEAARAAAWSSRARGAVASTVGCLALLTLLRNVDYRSPAALWKGALLEAPAKAKPYFALGMAIREGAPRDGRAAARAERLVAAASRAQPEDPRSDYLQGMAALQRRDLASAERLFEQAFAKKPDYLQAAVAWAETAVARGDWPAASERFRRALNLKPGDAELAAKRDAARRGAEGAIDAARREAAANPADLGKAAALGDLLRQAGRAAEGRSEIEAWLSRNGEHLDGWNAIARLGYLEGATLVQEGRPAEGERTLREALAAMERCYALAPPQVRPALDQDAAQIWSMLGESLLRQDRRSDARAAWEKALSINPGHPGAREWLRRVR